MQKINPVGFWEGSGFPVLPLGAQSRGTPVPWPWGAGSRFPKRKTPGTVGFGETPPGCPRQCRAPSRSPVLRIRVGSSGDGGGRKDLLQHGITEAGASPCPGGRGGASMCPRGSSASGSPAATTPSALSPAERGERGLRWVAKPSTQDAAVPRGEGCGKSSGCRGRMLRARIPRESEERPALSPGNDGDLPGGTNLLRYLPRGGGKGTWETVPGAEEGICPSGLCPRSSHAVPGPARSPPLGKSGFC